MRFAILVLASFFALPHTIPATAQRDYPATATIRGENIWLRVDPAEDTEILGYLQRGDQIRVTGDAVPADGDAFYPIEVVETGEVGWVRDLAVDPRSFTPLEDLPEVVVDTPPAKEEAPETDEPPAGQSASDSRSPEVNPDEAAYAEEVSIQLQGLALSMSDLQGLLQSPQFGDENWTIRVLTSVAVWQVTQENALKMSPPLAFAEVHKKHLRALVLLNRAGDDIVEALETLDANRLSRANENIQLANDEISAMDELIVRIATERGLR